MAGWIFRLPAIISLFPGLVTMKFNTAACFVALGLATFLKLDGRRPKWIWRFLALLAVLIATFTLVEIIFGLDLQFDQLIIPDWSDSSATSAPGRMSAPTAISLTFLGVSLLGAEFIADRWRCLLLILVLVLGLSVFLSYPFSLAYGTSLFSYTGMAVHTSALLVNPVVNPNIGNASPWMVGCYFPGLRLAKIRAACWLPRSWFLLFLDGSFFMVRVPAGLQPVFLDPLMLSP